LKLELWGKRSPLELSTKNYEARTSTTNKSPLVLKLELWGKRSPLELSTKNYEARTSTTNEYHPYWRKMQSLRYAETRSMR
jgi:hypothetical protein